MRKGEWADDEYEDILNRMKLTVEIHLLMDAIRNEVQYIFSSKCIVQRLSGNADADVAS